MTITKTTGPTQMQVTWDTLGNVTDISFTQQVVFTDSSTGTTVAKCKGPWSLPSPGQGILNAMAAIYAAIPASGL